MEKQGTNAEVRKPYARPEIRRWGTVSDLTRGGKKEKGGVFVGNGPVMNGSNFSPGGGKPVGVGNPNGQGRPF